jgi:hypothetical protein
MGDRWVAKSVGWSAEELSRLETGQNKPTATASDGPAGGCECRWRRSWVAPRHRRAPGCTGVQPGAPACNRGESERTNPNSTGAGPTRWTVDDRDTFVNQDDMRRFCVGTKSGSNGVDPVVETGGLRRCLTREGGIGCVAGELARRVRFVKERKAACEPSGYTRSKVRGWPPAGIAARGVKARGSAIDSIRERRESPALIDK